MRFLSLLMVLVAGATSSSRVAAEWPQFLGPGRNGSSPETGLLGAWTAEGPKVVWKVAGGPGYSQVVVSGGRAYVVAERGGEEHVLALDAATGKELWSKSIGRAAKPGPSSTPAVDGDRLYVQSMNGPLFCLDSRSDKTIWERDLLKEFAGGNTLWGMTVSPLIDGTLLLTVSGGKGAGVVALDKTTGKVVWKNTDAPLGWASPLIMRVGEQRQAIFKAATMIVAVRPDDGKLLWSIPCDGGGDVVASTPVVAGDKLFISAGDPTSLFAPGPKGAPRLVWKSNLAMDTYWSTAVHHDRHLYGLSHASGPNDDLNCVEVTTGNVLWSQKKFGPASVTLADGKLYILIATGEFVVARATPTGYREDGRCKLLDKGRYVNAPTITGKRLYARDLKHIICLELAAK
jgi:outer membrane protein assembly factor BamB